MIERRPFRPSLLAPFALCLGLALVGCGKEGLPKPPEPRGPFPPDRVRARQTGTRAVVGFVVPAARGTKDAQQPVRADLIRVSYPPDVTPTTDPNAFRRRGELVASLDGDPLESGSTLSIDDPTLARFDDGAVGYTMRYGVLVRDRHGRPSPLVVAPDLVLLAPTSAPRDLRAEPTADGIRLVWNPPSPEGSYHYNLYRPSGEMSALTDPINAKPLTVPEYLDATVKTGETYTYLVRVALSDGTPYRESADSEMVTLNAEDRFAPAPPRGLVAVQEGLAVRLFWDPSPERDVRGYRVYRRAQSETGAGQWQRIGPDPVEQPLYLDRDVRLGERLDYRVTAIDRAEPPNESGPSESVPIELSGEPAAGAGDAR